MNTIKLLLSAVALLSTAGAFAGSFPVKNSSSSTVAAKISEVSQYGIKTSFKPVTEEKIIKPGETVVFTLSNPTAPFNMPAIAADHLRSTYVLTIQDAADRNKMQNVNIRIPGNFEIPK